ncbi:hypothetical protein J4E89_010501 [Alternaria sp. Ai002NY15]|nr:hypothetical protein J4E89_010501 [Alternaria sp. Ai002NY15]
MSETLHHVVRSILNQNVPKLIIATAGTQAAEQFRSFRTLFPESKVVVAHRVKASRREQTAQALKQVETRLVILQDDHTYWPQSPRFIASVIAPFEDTKVGAVSADLQARHRGHPISWPGFWNFMGMTYLMRRSYEYRGTYGIDRGLSTLPGRFGVFRTTIYASPEFLNGYLNSYMPFKTEPLNSDDDKFHTRWLIEHDWKMGLQAGPDSVMTTELGEWPKFMSQVLRWTRTTWRNNPAQLMGRLTWVRHPFMSWSLLMWFFRQSLTQEMCMYMTLRASLKQYGKAEYFPISASALTIWILSFKFVKILEHFRKYPRDVVYFPAYLLFGHLHAFVKIYALCTCMNASWTTAEKVNGNLGKGKMEDVKTEDVVAEDKRQEPASKRVALDVPPAVQDRPKRPAMFVLLGAISHVTSAVSLETRQAQQKVTIDLTKRYQTIDGFGFSGAFQRANLIVNLQQPKQREVLDLLFNTTTGAGFSIVRNGIGSTPNSNSDFMNTILPKCPSTPAEVTTNYSGYVWDAKDSGQLFLSQRAQEYGVNTFYANAWSAPGCMKTNNQDTNGGQLCGVSGTNCRSGDWKQAYANYLVAYINFYASAGIKVTHLGFLNEPDLSTSYASMQSSGTQAAEFIKVLRPTLDRANLTSVGINCCEATGWNVATQHAQQIASAGAESLVYAITSHEYTSRISGTMRTAARVWQTEYSDLSGGWSTAWYSNGGAGDGFTWANTVFNGIVNSNLSAYIFWEGVQDRATNNNNNEKLILVDGQNYQVSKRLWAFAQFRIVRPGAVRVGAGGGANVKAGAFVNGDGSVAVVVINSAASAQSVGVALAGYSDVKAWYTDNTHDMNAVTVAVGSDGTASASVPGRAMISFLFKKAANATMS